MIFNFFYINNICIENTAIGYRANKTTRVVTVEIPSLVFLLAVTRISNALIVDVEKKLLETILKQSSQSYRVFNQEFSNIHTKMSPEWKFGNVNGPKLFALKYVSGTRGSWFEDKGSLLLIFITFQIESFANE